MTAELKILVRCALACALACVLSGCARTTEAFGGETNWLMLCEDDGDCTNGSCLCGVCTLPCETGADCRAPNAGVCRASERVGSCEAIEAEGMCLPGCADDEACGEGFECSEGACVRQGAVSTATAPRGFAGATGTARAGATSTEDASDAGIVADELALTLLWTPGGLEERWSPSGLCMSGPNTHYNGQVAQPIDVEVSLPMVFDISNLPPPPEEALVPTPLGHAGGWTTGHLVLYRDGNGNGSLDPRDLTQDSPDEVVGTSGDWALAFAPTLGVTSYVIYYSDERLPELGPTIEAGYNLFRDVTDTAAGGRTAVPLDTPVPVPLRDEPKVQTMNCEQLCFAHDDEFRCPASVAELPDGGTFECDESSSNWWRTRCDGCLCFTAACSFDGQPCPAE